MVLTNHYIQNLELPLSLSSQPLPVAQHSVYLGIVISSLGVEWRLQVQCLAQKGWTAYSQACGCGMHHHGFPIRLSLPFYSSFVRSSMEYGLALGLWSSPILKPLLAIQNCFVNTVTAWHTLKVGVARLGLPSIPRHAQELSAMFLATILSRDNTVLAVHIACFAANNPIPDSCITKLYQNELWCNLEDPTMVSSTEKGRWGADEHQKLASESKTIQLFNPQ